MSEWIDFFVYATLIVALWFVLPTWSSRFTGGFVADRNPEWLSAHPEVAKKLTGGLYLWAYYAWGLLSLAVLSSFQVGIWRETLWLAVGNTPKWEVLKDVNSTLLFPGIIWFGGTGLLFNRWLQTTVPLAERRQATLERRSIDDYVPRWLRMATYGLVGIVLLAWLTAGLLKWYSTPIFWERFAFLLGLTPAFALFVRLSVNRRPNALDRVFGPGFRRGEIRYGFAMHLLPPVIGIARLYEEVTNTHMVDVIRALHLGVALIIIVWALRFATYAKGRGDQGVERRSPTMKSPAIVVLVAAITLLGPVDGWAQEMSAVPSNAEIRNILVDRIDSHRQGVGIVVGVIEPAGRRVMAYGRRAKDDTRPIDGDTVFELASVTKAFTSLLLADAVGRGDVSLTDPVAKYLPTTVRVPERGGRAITLHDLATHTSGLPREPLNLQPKEPWNPFADYSVEQLYQFLSSYQLTKDIGTEFDYSNLGAGLLGHVLARRAGSNYDGVVRARITGPLGMTSTGMTLSATMRARLAVGHNRLLEPVGNWDSPTLAGAGALRSTANDMLTFLAAALGYRESPLTTAFGAMAANRRPTGSPVLEIGLGWGVLKERETEILFVNGRSGGYRTWLGYEPVTRRGVVVLTNADSTVPPDDIGRHLLNPAFPLVRTFPPASTVRTETRLAAATLDRYAGRYQLAPAVVLTVTRHGDRVFSQLTGEPPFEMFAEGERNFFLKAAELQMVFETSADGKATAVMLRANGAEQRAPRIEGAPVVPVEVAIDSGAIDAMVGRYQIAPNVMLTISRQATRVFAQITGQPPAEIFASGQRQFFYKVVDAQLTFEGDAQGRLTAVVLHQSGRELRAVRVE